MDRRGKVSVALMGVALVWVGAKQFGGSAAPADPVIEVVAQTPMRQAAGTPLAGYDITPRSSLRDAVQPTEAEAAPAPEALADAGPCAASLEAFAEDGALIGLTLMAPCQPDARVELHHAGLVVAMRTLATGSLFTELPAMDAKGEVEAVFDDGSTVRAAAPVPDLAGLRRFAVQGNDRFALNGFERGADYGQDGHMTAANGGVLVLGDATARAEVYTFPDPAEARVTIEAEVTEASCGRELAGQTLYSENGMARLSELTLAMPECDAAGGFVVLNNPLPETTLAAAE